MDTAGAHCPAAPIRGRAARSTPLHGRVVIVCGARDYGDSERVFAALDLAHARAPITLLVHGASLDMSTRSLVGTDRWADEWAREHGVKTELHLPVESLWGKAAEAMRNKQMAEAGAHGVIALPGDAASESLCRHAQRFGIAVWRPFGRSSGAERA